MGIEYGAKNLYSAYGVPALDLTFADKKNLIDRISGNNLFTFTRTSSATYVGSDGLIKSASANEARFDHNPITGASLGLLIEEQRSNLFTYSKDFSSGWNPNQVTITTNSALAPDGTNTAALITTNTVSSYNTIEQAPTLSTNTDYCYSVFVKLVSGSGTSSRVVFGSANNLVSPVYASWGLQLDTLAETTDGNTPTVKGYIAYPNGWYRIYMVLNTSAQTNAAVAIRFGTGGVDNVATFYVWGAQVEAGSFPTSYIPTTASTVTRTGDSASITGSNLTSFYNQNQGTLFCRFRNFGYGNAYHAGSGVSFDNNQFQRNMISLNMRRDGPFYRNGALVIFNDTTFTDSLTTSGSSNNINDTVNYYNFVGSFSSTKRAFTYNGITPGVNSTTITMPTISRFLISTNSNYVYDAFTGYISRISYYPFQLTDSQLQNLTK